MAEIEMDLSDEEEGEERGKEREWKWNVCCVDFV
jgi:hypothetical protein